MVDSANTTRPDSPSPIAPEPRILMISGSPRRNGNTDAILALFAEEFSHRGIAMQTTRICDIELHPCTGCEACRTTGTCSAFRDEMSSLYPVIERSRGLVIASPTYNYTVTPEIKAFIDRLYPYYDFEEPRPGPYRARLSEQGRLMIPIGICEQNDVSQMRYTIPVMRDALEVVGYETVTEIAITGHFYKGTAGSDEHVLERIRTAAALMADRITA